MRIELPIEGMTCEACAAAVRRALTALPGVGRAEVHLAAQRAILEADPVPPRERLAQAVAEAGYRIGENSPPPALVQIGASPSAPVASAASPATPSGGESELLLDIEGMHCASCVGRVEQALTAVPGVRAARANLATEQAAVTLGASPPDTAALLAAVERAGYRATPTGDEAADDSFARADRERRVWLFRFLGGLALLAPIVLAHFLASDPRQAARWQLAPATVLQGLLGWPYLVGALRRLRHGTTSMDTLIALGTSAAYAAGLAQLFHAQHGMYFMDAAMILVFITLGKYLELRARGRASSAIRRLLELAPREANVLAADGSVQPTPLADVPVGATILVRPGDKTPLDGRVLRGRSTVDQSWLTGESIAVEKTVGDELLAGTVNGPGSLEAQVTRPVGRTTLAEVVRMMRRAQESKTDMQRLADRIVIWFVPAVLAIALGSLVVWGPLVGDWPFAWSALAAVLVVACPCALGLATPTAILVAGGRGAALGILVKSAHALELAPRVDTIVLDKTGTVTAGRPQVTDVLAEPGVAEEELLAAAAAAELGSNHPLAEPIIAAARERGLAPTTSNELQVIVGKGVVARVAGAEVLVGNERLLAEHGAVPAGLAPRLEELRSGGKIPLVVARQSRLLGVVAVADPIAPAARAVVESLRSEGQRVVMLTGDHAATARAVAEQAGIDQFRAELLPADKLDFVRQRRAAGEVVAMVGDGINDAPALAAADLGVAIGSGADVALEAADVVLVQSDLRGLLRLFSLARATLRTIRQNLAWALVYNLLLLPLAAGLFRPFFALHLPPVAAAVAMAASSVSVVANSLLLARRRIE